MDYTQITPDQREHMLETIGVSGVDELFDTIPEPIRFEGRLDLPGPASELELQRELSALAERNVGAHDRACFMGAGAYDHFIPAFIDQLVSRGEFLTAYTPYQAEASQGALQAFFEFQTQVARLTGLDIANASLYEGSVATAEAAILAVGETGKRRVLVAETVHPDHRHVLETYLHELAVECVTVPVGDGGVVDPSAIAEHADNDTACLVVQSPNVFGLIEDWAGLFDAARSASGVGKAPLGIAVFNPISLGLLKTPGACGADLAAGEGQPLGIALSFGGPYLGLLAAKKKFMRRLPGRLIGRTTDADGRPSYCLTLQTREQHIRRAKATSNVCTNQGLMALRASMYMTAMGPGGLRAVAEQCYHKAHYLADRIAELPGCAIRHPSGRFFNEFVVRCPIEASRVIDAGCDRGLLAGVAMNAPQLGGIGSADELLIAVTEKRTKQDMDALVDVLRETGD